MLLKRYLVLSILSMFCLAASAQQVSPEIQAQVRSEISKRGLEEAAVRQRLLQNGIDVDKLTMEDLPVVQPKISKIIAEMEAEKKAEKAKAAPKPKPAEKVTVVTAQQSEAVQEKVEEGASIEEAVVEELLDERNEILPPSKIYGQALFRNKSLELYRASKDIIPPDSYVLSSGDIININIFGASQADLQFEVEADGFIRPSGLPKIYLKGLKYGAAKVLLARRFAQGYLFKNGEFAVSLNTARTMTINIFGEVEQPGSYSISAINTAFNALIAAGGPTDIGSVRNIQLIRDGKSRSIDVFAFMQDPTVQYDFYLENNDILFVSPVERMISLSGAVIRPMRYELKKGEELSALLNYAGGLKSSAYTDLIQITRLENNERILIDLNLGKLIADGKDFRLMDGDVVSIKSIEAPMEKVVSISGPLRYPGEYALTEGMRISDLVEKGLLEETARLDMAFLSRRNAANGQLELIPLALGAILEDKKGEADVFLQKGDKLLLFTQARYLESYEVSISGSVRNAGSFAYDDTLRISDLIYLAGGLKETALGEAYIVRTSIENPLDKEYLRIDLNAALEDAAALANISLLPNDQIKVLDKMSYLDAYTISITGAVRNPGEFAYAEGLRISDLIKLSNGTTETVLDFAYVLRTKKDNPLDKEYIRIDLASVMADEQSAANIALEALDVVRILDRKTFTEGATVSISGAVRQPGEFGFQNSLKLVDLVRLAGGLSRTASPKRVEVFRVLIDEDNPTKTLMYSVDFSGTDYLSTNPGQDFDLQAYDQVIVRELPDFRLQETIRIEGEVLYPGEYALLSREDKLADLLERAGGLTVIADLNAANLYRSEQNKGNITISMDKAIKRPGSYANIILRQGDVISIPAVDQTVTIYLEGTKIEKYGELEVATNGKIVVPYSGKNSAKWYIKEYANGFYSKSKRNSVIVNQPNGYIAGTKGFLGIRTYPTVEQGAEIRMQKKEKKEKQKRERKEFDSTEAFTTVVGGLTTALTLLLLVQQLGN